MMSLVSRLSSKTIVISLVVLSSAALGFSQQTPTKSSDFNVEILNLDNRSHTFSIPEPPHQFSYFAHVNLKRVPDWKPSAEVPEQAGALQIKFWLADGSAEIEITAYLGKMEPNSRPYEWERMTKAKVLMRALGLDETVTITETERFGIAPFDIKVSRARPWSVGQPQIINKTQALTVSGIIEARPTYILNIRNVSHKAINAIRWYGQIRGQQTSGSGISGESVIAPGSAFELRQHFEFQEEKRRTDSDRLEFERTIVIAAIVFDDGTFEGEANAAAEMAANVAGEQIQLTQINRLARSLAQSSLRNPELLLKKLKADIAALSESPNQAVVDEVVRRFAAADEDMRNRRVKEEIGNGLRSTKSHFLREIEKLEFRLEQSSDVDFDLWIKDLLDNIGKMRTN